MKKYNICFLIIMCLGITIQDSFGYSDLNRFGFSTARGERVSRGLKKVSANDSSKKSSSIRNDQPKKVFEIVNLQAMRKNEYLVSWRFPRRGEKNIDSEFHLTLYDDGYFYESLSFQDLSNGLNEKEKFDYFKENIVLTLGIDLHDKYNIKGCNNINMFLKDAEKLYYTMEKWISIAKSKNLTSFERVYDDITFKVEKTSYDKKIKGDAVVKVKRSSYSDEEISHISTIYEEDKYVYKAKHEEIVLKLKFKVKKSSRGEVHYTTVIYEEDKRYASGINVVTEFDLDGVKNLADMKSMNEFLALLYNKVKVIDDANRSWK